MPKPALEQPDVAPIETGKGELLRAHQAISDAWYSNWQIEQRDRLERLLTSRSASHEKGKPN
jgi:hypothetical protein